MEGTMNGVVKQVRDSIPSSLPIMDQSTLQKLKEQALAKARHLQEQVSQLSLPCIDPGPSPFPAGPHPPESASFAAAKAVHGVSDAAAHTNAVARDVASSKDRREAQRKLWAVWQRLDFGTWVMRIARALVCIYFLNLSYDDVQTFR